MANSIHKDITGPDWPLGFIAVPTPGTPVNIMSLVDSTAVNSPVTSGAGGLEYTPIAWEIQFTACKLGATHGLAPATGNVYIVRQATGSGSGNRDDPGAIVAVIGITTQIQSASYRITGNSQNRNSFSPYRYYIDADIATEGALVTLIPQ